MSSHIWDIPAHKIQNSTLLKVLPALQVGLYHGLNVEADLCRWLGYAVECQRQQGGMGFRQLQLKLADAQHAGYKFCKGRNADNYLRAGVTLLTRVAAKVGLPETSPAYAILDKLQEDGLLQTPDGVRPLDKCSQCGRPCIDNRYSARPTAGLQCERCLLKRIVSRR